MMFKNLMTAARNAQQAIKARSKQMAALAIGFIPVFAHAGFMEELTQYATDTKIALYAFSFAFFMCCVAFGGVRLAWSRVVLQDHSYGWGDFLQVFLIGAAVGGGVAVFGPWAWQALGGTM